MKYLSSGMDPKQNSEYTYMTKINQVHGTLKFSYELSETKLTFLDITVYKGERFKKKNHVLDVYRHIKPTNKQTIIHPRNFIPPPNHNKCHKQR